MNVWGKRSFEAAFPNDAIFGTVIAREQLLTSTISGLGGDLTINGNGGGVTLNGNGNDVNMNAKSVHITTDDANGGLFVTGGTSNVSINAQKGIEAQYLQLDQSVSGAGVTTPSVQNPGGELRLEADEAVLITSGVASESEIVLTGWGVTTNTNIGMAINGANAGDFSLVLDRGINCQHVGTLIVRANTVTSALSDLAITAGNLVAITANQFSITTPIQYKPSINNNPIITRSFIMPVQVSYTPAGPSLRIVTGGSYGAWDYAANQLGTGSCIDTTFAGTYDALALATNDMDLRIRTSGGPDLFVLNTNQVTTAADIIVTYNVRLFSVVTVSGAAGTLRTTMTSTVARLGGGGVPTVITNFVLERPIDTTVANFIDYYYGLSSPTANLTTESLISDRV